MRIEIEVMGQCYEVERKGDCLRVTAESGESYAFTWDGVRLVGPSYARVTSEFRAHLASQLKNAGLIVGRPWSCTPYVANAWYPSQRRRD